jgi:catechol 2,3-dioxygenase
MIETYGLTHLSIATQDLQRSYAFYRRLLGMQLLSETEKSISLQTPGSRDLLALELRPSIPSGMLHFGFRAKSKEDVLRAAQEAEPAGGTLLKQGEFAPGAYFVYLLDPDQNKIEIWFEPDTARE